MPIYLRVKNTNIIENIIYKMKPDHSSLEVKDLNDWMEKAVNNYSASNEDFSKLNFNQKLSFKGIVKYDDYYTTGNGILIDIEKKKSIRLSENFYKYCIDIFEIIPELKKLEKLADFDLEALYDYYFISDVKNFPDFTQEEWEDFIDKGLDKKGLEWTEKL